jgi:uncharacterized membrane protein
MRLLFLVLFPFMQAPDYSTITFLRQQNQYFYMAELLDKEIAQPALVHSITFEYSFVTLEWTTKDTEDTWLSIKISSKFNVLEVWCKDETQRAKFEDWVRSFETVKKSSSHSMWLKSSETERIQNALRVADQISSVSRWCDGGDDYENANYNKILITERGIFLEQSNSWNARSLDRENYILRELAFFVSFKSIQESDMNYFKNLTGALTHQQAGELLIYFSDHSSQSKRSCGNQIREAIAKVIH